MRRPVPTYARRSEDGAALVEFALVSVLLLLLVIGILSYGLILGLHQSITHTASAAARAAVVVPPDEIPQTITAVVDRQLSWLGGRGDLITPTHAIVPCNGSPARQCVRVTVSYPYQQAPFIPSLLGLPIPQTITSTATLELEDL
jgi:Flp pilus assembly protein TadG